jgi:hypothetical protein
MIARRRRDDAALSLLGRKKQQLVPRARVP